MHIQIRGSQVFMKRSAGDFVSGVTKLLIVALLVGGAAAEACERPIQVVIEKGKLVAQFKVGDSRCSLVKDEVLCTPVNGSESIAWSSRP